MLDGHLTNKPDNGVQFLKRAVDLLEWGRNVWKNVHKDDRGAIFQDTFLRGVRSLHLKMFMNVRCESCHFGYLFNRMIGLQRRSWLELQVPP